MTKKFLIIQTAFIGDVILATALIEKLKSYYPDSSIDFLVRKGNESLLVGNPHLNKVLIWDKKQSKIKNLFGLVSVIRQEKYNYVVNCHRFISTGILTAFSGAGQKIGFKKNPLSFLFNIKAPHQIGDGTHETQRNQALISHLTDTVAAKPRLYPSLVEMEKTAAYKGSPYLVMAPTSVWFTKQYPVDKWIELIDSLVKYKIYLVGAKSDFDVCDRIREGSNHPSVTNLAGHLSFLDTAALMTDATMNYVNDSAPMHIASSVNAPVRSVFCSTVPEFGFTPLSDNARVIQTTMQLDCRPCGIHGYRQCPKGHFNCAYTIDVKQFAISTE
jgi:ADP-heptose:LPS heptosyltransferase